MQRSYFPSIMFKIHIMSDMIFFKIIIENKQKRKIIQLVSQYYVYEEC